MKTCKNCKQIVNVETITCPNCEEHEFKLSAVKICSLCGKVNQKKNKECELCGKSFSGKANDFEIATVMNLTSQGEKEREYSDIKKEALDKKTPQERYIAIKGEIESGGNEDRCAFFIPGELKEKPIILLPSFEESEKVDVYLVLSNSEMPEGMQKVDISKEEDINTQNIKNTPRRKTSIAAFGLFWLNLAMICAFGLKMIGETMGFQIIVSSFGGNNAAGQRVITAMESTSAFGSFAHLVYPVLFGLIAIEVILSLIFIRTKETKGKKVFLIVMQSIIFAFAIGAYLASFLMISGAKWQDIETGMILLAACGFAGMLISMFYQYPKSIKGKKEQEKQRPADKQEDDSELVGLGYDIDNE